MVIMFFWFDIDVFGMSYRQTHEAENTIKPLKFKECCDFEARNRRKIETLHKSKNTKTTQLILTALSSQEGVPKLGVMRHGRRIDSNNHINH